MVYISRKLTYGNLLPISEGKCHLTAYLNLSVFCFVYYYADGYSEDHIKFKWEKDLEDGMSFVPSNLEMLPQYTLTNLSLTKMHNVYVVGTFRVYGRQ